MEVEDKGLEPDDLDPAVGRRVGRGSRPEADGEKAGLLDAGRVEDGGERRGAELAERAGRSVVSEGPDPDADRRVGLERSHERVDGWGRLGEDARATRDEQDAAKHDRLAAGDLRPEIGRIRFGERLALVVDGPAGVVDQDHVVARLLGGGDALGVGEHTPDDARAHVEGGVDGAFGELGRSVFDLALGGGAGRVTGPAEKTLRGRRVGERERKEKREGKSGHGGGGGRAFPTRFRIGSRHRSVRLCPHVS